MPHHRKYVPHSWVIAAWPSRAKRSMISYASQGLSSRLSRSARCALLAFRSPTLASTKRKSRVSGPPSRPPGFCLSTATYRLGVFASLRHVTQRYLHPRFTARAFRGHAARRGLHSEDRVANDHVLLAPRDDLRAAHRAPPLFRRRHHDETIYS